jgi:hypothetical protein
MCFRQLLIIDGSRTNSLNVHAGYEFLRGNNIYAALE